MILIISNENDFSTNEVVGWINFLKPNERLVRISNTDKVTGLTISKSDIHLQFSVFNGETVSFNFSEISKFWFRRGDLDFLSHFVKPFLHSHLSTYQSNEIGIVWEYVNHKLKFVNGIGSVLNASVNKLIVNDYANQCGLLTPDFLISDSKLKLQHFINDNDENVITKAIFEGLSVVVENKPIVSYTEKIDNTNLSNIDEFIFPSLLQTMIDKKYELRIFYLDGDFYPMAIFSQLDNQTAVDFRKYNDTKPNRNVPFIIPENIANSLHELMKKLDLKTGSIDMILTNDGEYIFLEVNPVGQFGMTSYPCRYQLERKIAEYLIK